MKKNKICDVNNINIQEVLMLVQDKNTYQYSGKTPKNIEEQNEMIESMSTSIEGMSCLYPTKYTMKRIELAKTRLALEKEKLKRQSTNEKPVAYAYSSLA